MTCHILHPPRVWSSTWNNRLQMQVWNWMCSASMTVKESARLVLLSRCQAPAHILGACYPIHLPAATTFAPLHCVGWPEGAFGSFIPQQHVDSSPGRTRHGHPAPHQRCRQRNRCLAWQVSKRLDAFTIYHDHNS